MASRAGLVTGGSSGIGKALARTLGQEGYAVTICGRDPRKLASAADELISEGVAVDGVAADLADERAIEELVEAHRRAHGRMDVLVNSAADGTAGLRIDELPTDVLDHNLDVNLRALFLTLRASVGFHELLDRALVGEVGGDRLGRAPLAAELVRRRCELLRVAAGDRDRVTLLPERPGQRVADPARAPGDQPRPRRHGARAYRGVSAG